MSNQSWNSLEKEFLYYAAMVSKESEVMDALKLVTTGKAALDGIKLLYEYAEDIKDKQRYGEFMRIIGLLQLELAETNQKLAEKIDAETEYKKRIKQLEKEIEDLKNPENKVEFKDGFYYKENDENAYCTGCYDSNKKLIHIIQLPAALGMKQCPVCKRVYK